MNAERREAQEIRALILSELENISQLNNELSECKKEKGKVYRRAMGSILHDFYNACERVFEIIARRINGGLDEQGSWHKQLLYRMTIDVSDIRPAVISKELASELDEYLSFRHLFRNIYGFELETERLDRLIEKFERIVLAFRKEILDFLEKL